MIKSMRIRWAWLVAHLREMRNTCKVLFGKPGGNRLPGRLRHRREFNINTDLEKISFGAVD
jgi:hypothetical protein